MTKVTCPTCDGAKQVVYSCCTGDVVDNDYQLCPVCKEHLGEEDCETCDGTGEGDKTSKQLNTNNMQKVILIGRIGKDATVNDVNGKKVINFSLCHSESWKNAQGEKQEKSTWFDCSYWKENTAVAQYITKGSQVYVEGQVDVRTYQAADGSTKATLSVKVGMVQLLGGGEKQPAGEAVVNDNNDDLPF